MIDSKLRAYIWATAPCRWWSRMRLRARAQTPVCGLFLHRVADEHPNAWTISNRQFDRMLEWLESHVDLVSIDEAQHRIQYGNEGRLAVHISFDDGYADNCLHAVPTLLSREIPFTYYVTTHNVRNGKPFPHDLKAGNPLAPNSIEEIRAMADGGAEIGVHTRTHADIGQLRRISELATEIRGARFDLAEWIGYLPKHFAFPYGLKHNVTPRAIQYVHDEGFSSYCTADGGYNFPFDGPFHLRRFHGDPCLPRLQNWLSFDPRHVFARPEFEYLPFQRPPRVRDIPPAVSNERREAL